jgi:hypothetical protein
MPQIDNIWLAPKTGAGVVLAEAAPASLIFAFDGRLLLTGFLPTGTAGVQATRFMMDLADFSIVPTPSALDDDTKGVSYPFEVLVDPASAYEAKMGDYSPGDLITNGSFFGLAGKHQDKVIAMHLIAASTGKPLIAYRGWRLSSNGASVFVNVHFDFS